MRCANLFLLILFVPIVIGCKNDSEPTASIVKTDYVDASITEFQNLGWTGVLCQPLNESVSFPNPNDNDTNVSPGGLVVREVLGKSPASEAGLQVGDVLVGVNDQWLPIKDNPSLDFVRELENQIAAAENKVELKLLRKGELMSVSFSHGQASLDEGLPTAVIRLSESARKGLKKLADSQNDDGSLGNHAGSANSRIQISAISGLAFLASGDKEFQPNAEKCLGLIAAEIDSLIGAAKKADKTGNDGEMPGNADKAAAGTKIMQMPTFEMDPLTASYALSFLAESNTSIMSPEWMPRILGLIGSLRTSQHESGGWNVAADADEESPIDVEGTHTTNQVLLAIGLLERKGMLADEETIKKACGFLKSQLSARAAGSLDRRLKTSLTAGTAVALNAINCQRSDATLRGVSKDGLARVEEQYTSPTLALPGVLSASILARQTGNENWINFHNGAKYWLTSIQLPDGSFKPIPETETKPLALEQHAKDPAWQAAHYCLLLSMQSGNLKKLTGETVSPMMVARNSSGEKSESSGANSAVKMGMPGGAQVIQFDAGDLEGGDLQAKIREKLKEQGIDVDNMKIEGLDGLPGGEKKK